jgi:excinuclease ABC subunit C
MGYFRAKRQQKAWRLVRDATGVDWEYLPSEFASLLRELELIKVFRPPYNVHQKRDGIQCFVRITGGPAPRLQVTRRIKEAAGTYFGPLPGDARIVAAVKELNDVLLLRDCQRSTPIRFADQADLFPIEMSALCARHDLGRCMAPCAARCTQSAYRDRVQAARVFLYGRSDEPMRLLEARMVDAAERMEFEHAASLRDRIGRLEMLREELRRFRDRMDSLSFLYAVPGVDGDHRIYAIRGGWVRGMYEAPRTAGERRVLLAAAAEHYARPEAPDDSAMRLRMEEMLLLAHWFRVHPEELERAYSRDRWAELPLSKQMGEQQMA